MKLTLEQAIERMRELVSYASNFDNTPADVGEMLRDELSDHLSAMMEAKAVVEKQASDTFTLEERRIVCLMEHDIHKFGELQCDYNGWMRDLSERRAAAIAAKGATHAK